MSTVSTKGISPLLVPVESRKASNSRSYTGAEKLAERQPSSWPDSAAID